LAVGKPGAAHCDPMLDRGVSGGGAATVSPEGPTCGVDAEEFMKSEFWRFDFRPGRLLRGSPPTASARATMGSKAGAIAIPALVILVPLLAFGTLMLNWLDADDAVKRRDAQQQAGAQARRVEAAALSALDARSRAAFERIEAVRKEGNPVGQLRQLIYSGEISYVLVQRGTELVFPKREDWAFPTIEDKRRQLLSVAADPLSAKPWRWFSRRPVSRRRRRER
jgi:hypothetical protein